MRSIDILSTLALLVCMALMPAACKVGLDRQYQWDMVRAENRCNWGYEAYCRDLARLQGATHETR